MAKTGIELKGLAELITRVDEAGLNVKPVLTNALEQMAETVAEDTVEALAPQNLPRQGRYSTGATEAAVVQNAQVEWSGNRATIGFGFDKTKPNNGLRLITGTPRMKPDIWLQRIYGGWARAHNAYQKGLTDDIEEVFLGYIETTIGGK